MMLADETLYGPAIQHIYEMIVNNELYTAEKEGPYEQVDVVPAYMERFFPTSNFPDRLRQLSMRATVLPAPWRLTC